MKNILSFLQDNFKYLVIIYFAVQLLYLFFFPLNYVSDSAYNFKMAQESLEVNSFFPAPQHYFEDYIVAPLYINLTIFVLKIYNSKFAILAFNILLNFLQLFFLYNISKKLFNKDTAILTGILYLFYLNNLGLILFNLTELAFGVLVLGSIYFFLQDRKILFLISGLLAGAALGVRAVGWALITAYVFIFFFDFIKSKSFKVKYIFNLLGTAVFILLFGFFVKSYFGDFIYTATTGPANILIGANDDANGSFDAEVFNEGKDGYIPDAESKSYKEEGEFYQKQAINWIKENPFKWAALLPLKFAHMFLWDDFTVSKLLNMYDWNLFQTSKYIIKNKSLSGLFGNKSVLQKILYPIIQIYHHLFYFVVLLLIVLGVLKIHRNENLNQEMKLILFFSIIGLAITIVVFGAPRFKYPYYIACLPFAGNYLYNKFFLKEN